MRKTFRFIIIIVIVLAMLMFWAIIHSFGPERSKLEIKQKIGGILLCEVVYSADQHSWQYIVDYSYKDDKGRVFKIGDGIYRGREWNKNAQLIPFKNWFILKTDGELDWDKVIVFDNNIRKTVEYEFSPDSIERDSVWMQANIRSLRNYLPSEAFIDTIYNGRIDLTYKYRIDEKDTGLLGIKKIRYKIDLQTGKPVMKEIL